MSDDIWQSGQARPELQRGPGNHSRGALITTSFRMCRDRDAEGVEREETWGGESPHRDLGSDLGSAVNSPSGVRGRAPPENVFYT